MNKWHFKQTMAFFLTIGLFFLNQSFPYASQKDPGALISTEVWLQATDLEQMEIMVELHQDPLVVFTMKNTSKPFSSFQKELYLHKISSTQEKLILKASKHSTVFEVKYEYSHLFNGFSVLTDQEGISLLLDSPEVKRIYGINEYQLHREYSVPSVSAPAIWEIYDEKGEKLSGKDILVGIIDTGIDYWHPDMGGGIGKKDDGTYFKVRGGYDYFEMHPIPNDGVMAFHGTHVAGIVAGTGEAGIATGTKVGKGVAPEASLMAYKVFGSGRRSTGGDAIMKALEASVKDGCDIVNLSLGKFFGWTEDPLSLICDRAVDAGIIVVASAGNDGLRDHQLNLFPLASPSSGLKVLSVASSDETIKPGFTVHVSDGDTRGAFPGQMLDFSPPLPENKKLEFIHVQNFGNEEDYENLDVSGKAALVQRGGLSFREKALIAQKHGAEVVLIYNNVPGLLRGTLGILDDYIPCMALSKEDGEMLLGILEEHPNSTLLFSYSQISIMSSFSSQGPTPDYYLKPDMTAPGSSILSSAPRGSYAYASGTSMSAPHVAGGAALLKQLRPDWNPSEIKSLLVNYSDIMLQPQSMNPYSVYQQGAGFMNLERSAKGFIVSDPVNLSFFHVSKTSPNNPSVFFDLSNKGNTAVKPEFEVWVHDISHEVSINEEYITIEPGESKTIRADIHFPCPQEPLHGQHEFRIIVRYDGQYMVIPGIFYYGDHEPMDHVIRAFSYPNLAISPNFDGVQDSNFYYFLSPNITDGIQVSLFDSEGKNHLGVLAYVRRRMGSGYFRVEFDGSVMGQQLPDGHYMFRSYILPKGADYQKQQHWIQKGESMVLIDRVSPVLRIELNRISPGKLEIKGTIEDNRASYGLILFYEIDDEDFSQIKVASDGTFADTLSINEDQFFIRFTAQDLAGNRTRIKKRIP